MTGESVLEPKNFNVGFDMTGHCVIQLRFPNKYYLSINAGRTGYNDNRNEPSFMFKNGVVRTNTVEVRLYDPEGKTVTKRFFKTPAGDDDIAGWVTVKDLLKAIEKINAVKP
jgi:hypothetical protein